LPRDAAPQIFDRLTPEIEAVAQRARNQLVVLMPHFEHGIPANEHLRIKVPLPIDQTGDVTEWLWIEATSFKRGIAEFVIPEHMGSYIPYNAGRAFHWPLLRILDYVHVHANAVSQGMRRW
jgi:hypothetical protein